MARYAAKRIVGMVPTVFILLFLVVVMIDFIPGDVIDVMMEEAGTNPELRARLEQELGLDRHVIVRYFDYAGNVMRGDFGTSLWGNAPIGPELVKRIPVTLEIAFLATVMGSFVGVLFGVVSALRQDSILDYALRSIAIAGISVPNFAIATFIVVMPAIWWGISPRLDYVTWAEDPIGHFKIILIPAMVLALNLAAAMMRLSRTTMLEVLRQDYIRTARAKGLAGAQVTIRHALKNALIPVITLMGLQVAFLIGGSVIVESVFVIPGLGRFLITSIGQRDYPVLQGIVFLLGFFVMTVNLLIDLSYAYFDPRIRYS